MSSKTTQRLLLVACLIALFAAPIGITASDTDDAFDVAARAELGQQGRGSFKIASGARIISNGRASPSIAMTRAT